MLRSLMAITILSSSVACASQALITPFSDAMSGHIDVSKEVRLLGIMDTKGVNFYSLFSNRSPLNSTDCLALILDRKGQKEAKAVANRSVEVSGRIIPLDQLNEVMPSEYGQIEGRDWSGTRCTGRSVVYVTSIRASKILE